MSSNIKIQRICQHCGNEFTARTTSTQYCGDHCSKRAYKARLRNAKIELSNRETAKQKEKAVEDLKEKAYLSIDQAVKLFGISRRSIYRMMDRKEIIPGKAGTRTILRRSDFDQLFELKQIPEAQQLKKAERKFSISDYYTLTEVQKMFGISESTLHNLVKRHDIPKVKVGWYAYVPKKSIDKLLK